MGLFGGGEDTVIRGNKIDQFDLNNSTYGLAVPVVIGTGRIAGNVIDWQDFTAVEHSETTHSGKGGGGSSTTQISYTYTVASDIGVCEGPANILRVWSDMDITSLSALGASAFNGAYGQNPWSYMTSHHPDHALPYSGLCHVAGVWDLGTSSSLPQLNFEVQCFNGLTNDGYDVNPADIINYIVSDQKNGVGFGTGNIDSVSMARMRTYAAAADMLVTAIVTEAKSAIKVVQELCECANTEVFWSQDKLKFVVNCDDDIGEYHPITAIQFSVDSRNFLPYSDGTTVKFSRKDSTDCYNSVDIEFTNRSNSYSTETATFKVTADVAKRGLRAASTKSLHFIHTKERAVKVATAQAYRSLIQRNTYTFRLGWNFCLLEPGDLIAISDDNLGLRNTVVEIQSVKEEGSGVYEFTAVEKPAGVYSAPEYDVHHGERPELNYNVPPGESTPPYIYTPYPDDVNGYHSVINVSGYESSWGGCQVWASEDNIGYRLLGTLDSPSRYGTLLEAVDKSATSMHVSTYGRVQLLSNPAGNTLFVDGEEIRYTGATLVGDHEYTLSGISRGQGDTVAMAHSAGAYWGDKSTGFTYCYDQDMDGKLVYIKLLPFNIFHTNLVNIADVNPIEFLIDIPNPPDVQRLNVELLASGTRRYWWEFNYPKLNNIAGFRIKYIQGASVNWNAATLVGSGLITEQPYESETIRHGIHTVMIKAVDKGGQESTNFASCILNMGDLLEDNVLLRQEYNADNVDITNGHVTEDNVIESNDNSMMWTYSDAPMWSGPGMYMWDNTFEAMTIEGIFKATVKGFFWFDYDMEGPATIFYKIIGEVPAWGYNYYDNMWKNPDAPMWDDDAIWKQYSTKVEIKAGSTMMWKIVCPAGTEVTRIKNISIVIDVPDRQEHFEDLAVPETGREIIIKTPNYYTTAVRIDAVQAGAGQLVLLPEIVSRNPCIIRLYDSDGNPASATVDLTWQGYEREII